MKDQIDVAVRRSPKYSVFMGIGVALGVIVAGILAMFVDPADMPMGYTVGKGLGLLLLILGTGGLFLGGFVALILDWAGRKRSKEYRVDAQIDMVDDPKEIARRRIAAANGEDPDATDDPADADGAAVTDAPAVADDVDDAAVAGDVQTEGGTASANPKAAPETEGATDAATDGKEGGRGPASDSTV